MSKYIILVALVIVSLLASCLPANEGEPAVVAVEATALPPVVQTGAPPTVATETFIPYIESEATATLVPPTATLPPTGTPEPTSTPTPVPAGIVSLVPVVSGGMTRPLYITHAGDDRLFVLEQPGLVRVIEDGQLLPVPFLDIRDRVGSISNEQGLLGLAFHPDYTTEGASGEGAFYLNYTDKAGDTVVSQFRVTADRNVADPASEEPLLTQDQPYPNHNGGLLKFGPDGHLYIGLGDGGSAGDPLNSGQRLDTWLGKILRIDVSAADGDYAIPPDNPFADGGRGLPEIWAYGVRNPWRFSFDRANGDFFMGDVGQNQWEEINILPFGEGSGANYGWRIMEANHCYEASDCDVEGLVLPVFEYDHSQGCSVTGGYVYRGQQAPALRGNYFFADYCLGTIWRLAPEGSRWSPQMLLDSDLVISSFGEDVNGELYVTDHARGAIYRLEPGE